MAAALILANCDQAPTRRRVPLGQRQLLPGTGSRVPGTATSPATRGCDAAEPLTAWAFASGVVAAARSVFASASPPLRMRAFFHGLGPTAIGYWLQGALAAAVARGSAAARRGSASGSARRWRQIRWV